MKSPSGPDLSVVDTVVCGEIKGPAPSDGLSEGTTLGPDRCPLCRSKVSASLASPDGDAVPTGNASLASVVGAPAMLSACLFGAVTGAGLALEDASCAVSETPRAVSGAAMNLPASIEIDACAIPSAAVADVGTSNVAGVLLKVTN